MLNYIAHFFVQFVFYIFGQSLVVNSLIMFHRPIKLLLLKKFGRIHQNHYFYIVRGLCIVFNITWKGEYIM